MTLHIDVHIYPASLNGEALLKLAAILFNTEKIMTKVSESATAQKANFTRLESALQGISGDVIALNNKVAELQATSGEVTAEDQALLDELQTMSNDLATRFEALDAQTDTPANPGNPGEPAPQA